VVRDITEHKAMEQMKAELEAQRRELARFQRLAELTEVSTSVIHQIGQPFTAIMNNVSAAKHMVSSCSNPHCQAGATLVDTDASLKLVQSTMRRLQALTHPERARREPKDLNTLVDEVLLLIQPEADSLKIELRTRLTSGLPLVALDEVQFSQALLNLLRNACEAVASCEPARRVVTVITSAGENGTLILEVSDLGEGIAPTNLPLLFEPFFTTKPNGTGVGLRLGRTIVLAHGGRLAGRNNESGPGATFQIVLPTAAGGGL
jgi:signal transduction histidine kinase